MWRSLMRYATKPIGCAIISNWSDAICKGSLLHVCPFLPSLWRKRSDLLRPSSRYVILPKLTRVTNAMVDFSDSITWSQFAACKHALVLVELIAEQTFVLRLRSVSTVRCHDEERELDVWYQLVTGTVLPKQQPDCLSIFLYFFNRKYCY